MKLNNPVNHMAMSNNSVKMKQTVLPQTKPASAVKPVNEIKNEVKLDVHPELEDDFDDVLKQLAEDTEHSMKQTSAIVKNDVKQATVMKPENKAKAMNSMKMAIKTAVKPKLEMAVKQTMKLVGENGVKQAKARNSVTTAGPSTPIAS